MQNVVVVLVRNQAGEFLSVKRAKGEKDNIVWSFPSGKQDQGETEEETVIREVREETGIICNPKEKVGERTVGNNVLNYWTAEFVEGNPCNPVSGEVSDVKFRSVKELTRLMSVDAMHVSVRKELGLSL
jgi:8-oxo-dGTP diphosphatase